MIHLNTILEQANIRRVLVVDDFYDAIPLASDLSALDADEWPRFFDDVNDDDRTVLLDIFADYDNVRADDLQASDEFVAALWNNRDRLRHDLIAPLFERYMTDTEADRHYLETLIGRLTAYGLICDTAGRQFQFKADGADIILIDLFLGTDQDADAMTESVVGLVKVIEGRAARPPLVILMSRSPRLEAKRQEFRDRSGLFESAFRIIRKADIADDGKLQSVLARLASHYGESLKLTAFLLAWQKSIRDASERTARLIRTLDLPDYGQINQLLLSAEGEPTGCYLVDVFDRVLQHEVEREAAIIDAAIELNSLTSEMYPPPYIAGSRDLQDLVHRSLFQNRERLRLKGAEGSCVAFGDLLRRKTPPANADVDAAQPYTILPDIGRSDILAVLTPACDLQRQGAKRVLLLAGTLKELRPTDWIYEPNPIRTPIIEFSDGSRFWIKWNLKHIETISSPSLDQALDDLNGFEVVARLRESHALELQQRLLSDLGRVGQVASMPATFAMRVEIYVPDQQRKPLLLDIPVLSATDGVCYVGRAGLKEMRLVLPEDACEAICEALKVLDLGKVNTNARHTLTFLRENNGELMEALIKGITLPSFDNKSEVEIPSPFGTQESASGNQKVRSIAWVCRNKDIDDNVTINKPGVVFATWDKCPLPDLQR